MNTTSTRTMTGLRSENATIGSQNESIIGTDNNWLSKTEGRNSSKLINVDTSSADIKKNGSVSSVLYLTKPRDISNLTRSQPPSNTKPESHRKDNDKHKSTTGVNVPQTLNEKAVATVPFRDWRRTLQVMPRMEDYLSTWPKSKTVSSHDRVTRTSSSMIHEINNKFRNSDSTVSNMDMQGNRRTSLG